MSSEHQPTTRERLCQLGARSREPDARFDIGSDAVNPGLVRPSAPVRPTWASLAFGGGGARYP